MAFVLDEVVPWGRNFDEYVEMFALTPADLERRILGCADGPASFNAEMHERGHHVVSLDPLYAASPDELAARIDATFDKVMTQAHRNRDAFVWQNIRSIDHLAEIRRAAMQTFLADFPAGLRAGRYLAAALPHLPFADRSFDLILCSHYLFLYSDQLSAGEHLTDLAEMCRVAREVRIYPLQALSGAPSPHVEPMLAALRAHGHRAEIVPVAYEFRRDSRTMLRVLSGAR